MIFPARSIVVLTVFLSAGLLLAARYSLASGGCEAAALPAAAKSGKVSLEEALAIRRSIRDFQPQPLTARQIGQLCWSAQGISDPARGYRTCPSAGALYPLELYLVTAEGVDHYLPASHALQRLADGDLRPALMGAAFGQRCVGRAPGTFVIAADVSRTERKYARRARRYVLMEVGHAGQNLLLQAAALGLGAVPVGAFEDQAVADLLPLPPSQEVLYLIPVGVPPGNG